jgi:carbon-monoxide dehydrogenase large subunit
VFGQIVADQLGVAVEDVILVEGDTRAFDWGVATFASRAAVVSGNAIHKTALLVRAQIIRAAANMLEASEEDIELRDGAAWIRGTDRHAPLAAIATASNPLRYAFNDAAKAATQFAPGEPSRRAAARRGPASGPRGDRLLQPRLRDLGLRRPRRYRRGRSRPLRRENSPLRLHPRLRQHDQPDDRRGPGAGRHRAGLGGALYERIEYDAEGNPLNANFVDFLMPYATEVPSVEVLHLETPTPLNPLGVKGVGEAGCIAVGAVIASGLADALAPFGAGRFHQTPITPSMIHAALGGR